MADGNAADEAEKAVSVAQPGDKIVSVEQPAVLLGLKELTDRSARIGQFKLSVFHPWEDKYVYNWGGAERQASSFKCLLIDVDDPTCYCHTEYKKSGKNSQNYEFAMKKFNKEGAVFIMKQIGLVKQSKSAYLSAPKRDVVDLALTTATAVVGLGQARVVQPCPPGTVGEKLHLKQDQRFDLTALIKTISPARDAGPERRCFDVELIDGSTNEAKDKTQVMKITLFQPKKSDIEEQCRRYMDQRLPVTLLQMYGSKSANGEYSFQSAFKGWRMMQASAEQPGADKAKILVDKAHALLLEDTESFATKIYEQKAYALLPGKETTVMLYLSLPNETSGIEDLDQEESLWQINWVHVHEPATQQDIYNKKGDRLWFPVTFRDATMQHTLWIQEKAALQLSGCDNASEFAEKHTAGKLWFPLICSLKIVRRRSVAQPAGHPEPPGGRATGDYDGIIVEAAEQDLKQTPTSSSLVLINMLASRMDAVDVFMPAALHMLRKSELYSMCVQFEPQELPHDMSRDLTPLPPQPLLRACNKVFCLVQATSGGEVLKIGSEGFKLITKGVSDVLTSSAAQPAPGVYTLTAFCTVDNLQDFKLDPPRGSKSQYALIVVSDIVPGSSVKEPTNIIVDSLMLLHRDEAALVEDSMAKMLYYVAAATEISLRKRKQDWSDSFSPAKAQRCRSISRHPTGEVLPHYTPDKRKTDATPNEPSAGAPE